MKRFVLITILLLTVMTVAPVSAYTLSGTIRDFCAPGITTPGCTQLSDFEGEITGLVTGMVSPTLNASGLPTYVGPGGATNATNFARWYVDSPGYNQSMPFSLTLLETSPGSNLFTYGSSAFFPIDNVLYGNQGRSHNYHFTMHLEGLTSFIAADTF